MELGAAGRLPEKGELSPKVTEGLRCHLLHGGVD